MYSSEPHFSHFLEPNNEGMDTIFSKIGTAHSQPLPIASLGKRPISPANVRVISQPHFATLPLLIFDYALHRSIESGYTRVEAAIVDDPGDQQHRVGTFAYDCIDQRLQSLRSFIIRVLRWQIKDTIHIIRASVQQDEIWMLQKDLVFSDECLYLLDESSTVSFMFIVEVITIA